MLIVAQLVNKLSIFYVTRRFGAEFAKGSPFDPVLSLLISFDIWHTIYRRSILILVSHPRLNLRLKFCVHSQTLMHATCPIHHILSDLIVPITLSEECKSWSFFMQFSQFCCYFFPVWANFSFQSVNKQPHCMYVYFPRRGTKLSLC